MNYMSDQHLGALEAACQRRGTIQIGPDFTRLVRRLRAAEAYIKRLEVSSYADDFDPAAEAQARRTWLLSKGETPYEVTLDEF